MTNIWAIILNYNGKDCLTQAVTSLLASRLDNNLILTILIVDNASMDKSFTDVEQKFTGKSNIKFIRNDTNLGFAAGNNVGIVRAAKANADYVFLLNNDAVVTPETLNILITSAQKQSNPSVLCPIITNSDGDIWYAGGSINWWRMRTIHATTPKYTKQTYSTELATGAAILIDVRVLARIGLWDESYFLYYEDADFSVRARAAGCFVGVVPTASVIHHEVSARINYQPTKTYWLVLSGLRFFRTHAPNNLYVFWYLIFHKLRKFANRINLLRAQPLAPAVARAWRDNALAQKNNNIQPLIPSYPTSQKAKNQTLTISIVYYHGIAELQRCLDSIAQYMLDPISIIIVNHSKQDITHKLTLPTTHNTQIIAQDNRGFGAGHNTTLQHTTCDIILCLNPDTELTMSLVPLLQLFDDERIGIVAPQLTTPAGAPQPHCHGSAPNVTKLLSNHLFAQKSNYHHTITTDWVSGGAMLLRRTDFQNVGKFDERFFLYYEDVDLCTRMRANGKQVIFFPIVSVTHVGGTSFRARKSQKYHYDASQDYYFRKHHGKIQTVSARVLRKVWRLLRG